MSTETVGLLGTGAQHVHLDFHTAPELWVIPTHATTFYNNNSVKRSIFWALSVLSGIKCVTDPQEPTPQQDPGA